MIGLSACRVLGPVFPAVFGGGSLYLGYVSIVFISGADKHYKTFGAIWSSVSTVWGYIVIDNKLSHFMDFRYSVSQDIISFELWYILAPTILFILFRLMQKPVLKHLAGETLAIILVLNFAFWMGIFSIAIAMAAAFIIS